MVVGVGGRKVVRDGMRRGDVERLLSDEMKWVMQGSEFLSVSMELVRFGRE